MLSHNVLDHFGIVLAVGMRAKTAKRAERFRTAVVAVTVPPASYRQAHEAAHAVAGIWNSAVAYVRTQWDAGNHNVDVWETKKFLATLPAAQRPVHAHTYQEVAFDLFDAIETARTNRTKGIPTRSPWRTKNYRPITFTRGFGWRVSARNGVDMLRLSFGRGRPPIWLPLPEIVDPPTGRHVSHHQWGEIKLCWDRDGRRWSLHIAVPTTLAPQLDASRVCAIDEGIINPVTLAAYATDSTDTQPIIDVTVVNGRELRAVKRDRNKAVGQISRKQSRCSSGSRRHRKLTAAAKKHRNRANRRLRDARHQISHDVVEFAVDHNTGTVTAGDVRGIERNTNRKRRASRSTRQQLSQWDRGTLEALTAHKLGLKEIGHIDESYSSQTCPACLTRNRPSGRRYRCRNSECGFTCHRDAVGAINILMRIIYGEFRRIDPHTTIRITYLRAVPRWNSRQRELHGKRARSNAQNRASISGITTDGVAGAIHCSSTTNTLLASHQGAVA